MEKMISRNYNIVCHINRDEFNQLVNENPEALNIRYWMNPSKARALGILTPDSIFPIDIFTSH